MCRLKGEENKMIFYIAGLCIYSIFDFFDMLGKSKVHEKVLFAVIFLAALGLGIWGLMG